MATLFFNNSDVAANKKHLTDEMRKYCRILSCRREYLCSHFGYEVDRNESPADDTCCDYCERIAYEKEGSANSSEIEEDVCQDISDMHITSDVKCALRCALNDFVEQEAQLAGVPHGHIEMGLPADIVNSVVAHCHKWYSHTDILNLYPSMKVADATNLYAITQAILQHYGISR